MANKKKRVVGPYVMQRQDQEDGSIHYEIWDTEISHRLCVIAEPDNDSDGVIIERTALRDARLIVSALNMKWSAKK